MYIKNLTIVYNSVVSANFVISIVDTHSQTFTLTPSDFSKEKTPSTTTYICLYDFTGEDLLDATFTITEDGYQTKTFILSSSDSDITIEMEEMVSITCTRDSTKDVIGHASQIDNNTLYNITDDTDVSLTLLNTLYPIGAIYIGTMNTCPLQVLGVGMWQLVSSGRVLQGVGSGQAVGTTVEAGLPNIEGTLYFQIDNGESLGVIPPSQSGLFNVAGEYNTRFTQPIAGGGNYSAANFNASRSNSIYGNSTTVQPPAYLVNIWERIQ